MPARVSGKATVQPHSWDRKRGVHVPAGNPLETRADSLEEVEIPAAGKNDRFLRGPIPWRWLVRASQLAGKALVIGLCLWRLKGAMGSNTVWLGNTELQPFGIDRAAKSRGLAALERAGLVTINREARRRPMITLLA